jgi:hypothetical protein
MREKEGKDEPQYVEDPLGVKIRGLPAYFSEEEIKYALEQKFGEVTRVKIPFDPKDEHLEES